VRELPKSTMPRSVDHRTFLETAPLVPLEFDATGTRLLWIGPQCEALIGCSIEEWTSPDFWSIRVFPDDQVAVLESRTRLAAAGGSASLDYRIEHTDGRVIWVCEVLKLVQDPEGPPTLQGYLTDITDRKREEVSLWKSEERLRALLRGAPDAMVLTDAGGGILNMNDQAESLFGYRLSEVVGSSIDHLVPDRLRARLPDLRGAFARDPHRRSLIDGHSFAIVRRDGTEIPVELSMSLIVGADDSRHILCSVRDLTARRRVEAQLRSSERRLREIANVLPAMVCFVDAEQRFRFVNDAYARWLGWEQRQMEGRLVREVIGEDLYAQMRPSMEAAIQGAATHFRGDVVDRSGSPLPVDVTIVPQHGEFGEVSGYFVVIFDVSDEVAAREADRRHREELAHVSRVATMGELTASIAHELNQPLSAIVANAQASHRLLQSNPPDVVEAMAAMRDIAADGRRAGEVISSMRQLLRRGEATQEPVETLALLRNVEDLLKSEAISRGVHLTTEGSDSGLPPVYGDATQLKQVFLNLMMNAIEATAQIPEGPREVSAVATLKGREVEVAVRDTGPGIPLVDPEELFAPFVSSRPDGMGRGLTISRTIMESHGGRLWAEPNSPTGAVFVVRLPLEPTLSEDR